MIHEVQEAIESARTSAREGRLFHLAEQQRRHSFDYVRTLVLAVVRELPDDMLVSELRDELEIAHLDPRPAPVAD